MKRRSRRPYPSQRYGPAHKAMRARLAPVVATGTVKCSRCDELIGTDEKWELDHRDDGRGWLGCSHQRCNARAGWEKMVETVNGNGGGFVAESPYRWSRRWCQEPPVGTEVLLGGGWSRCMSGAGSGRRSRSELVAIRARCLPPGGATPHGGQAGLDRLTVRPRCQLLDCLVVYLVEKGPGPDEEFGLSVGLVVPWLKSAMTNPAQLGCPATGVGLLAGLAQAAAVQPPIIPAATSGDRNLTTSRMHTPFRLTDWPIRSGSRARFSDARRLVSK